MYVHMQSEVRGGGEGEGGRGGGRRRRHENDDDEERGQRHATGAIVHEVHQPPKTLCGYES